MEVPICGSVLWITGLPGVGKSTLARALTADLQARGRAVVRLDGDRLRPILGGRYGYGALDRRLVAMIYARLCQEMANQGLDVVCATVSLAREARSWGRANISDYRVIYLRSTPELLAARLPKGRIAAARAGRLRNVPGVDLEVDEPDDADITIEDDGRLGAEQIHRLAVSRLWPQTAAP